MLKQNQYSYQLHIQLCHLYASGNLHQDTNMKKDFDMN